MQWICHVTIQGFYAQAVAQENWIPTGSPVVVLRDGRVLDGCREAFRAGLMLGAPARQVPRDVPGAAVVEFHQLDFTQAAAKRWWDECLHYTPYLEPAAPHQLFLSFPFPGQTFTSAIRAEVSRLLAAATGHGFVAFAGIAAAKSVARAMGLACRDSWLRRRPGADGHSEPTTVRFVLPGEEEAALAPLPLAYLSVSAEVRRRLDRLGLRTIGDVAAIAEGEWLRQLGPVGHQLARYSRGIDPEPVKPCYPPRSLTRRLTFSPEVRGRDQLEQAISRLAAYLARELEAKGEGCQEVALALQRTDGSPPARETRTLARLQQTAYPLVQGLQGLLRELLRQPASEAERKCGISELTVEASLIGPMPQEQLTLWADRARAEQEMRLHRALTLLHERFPIRMVGLGPNGSTSWRELLLQFSDPYRWRGSLQNHA